MNNKYRIRKTGEIVEVISYGGSTTRSDVLDFVSYIDSKGAEHEKEPLNLYWDLSPIKEWGVKNNEHRNLSQETANCDKQFDKILEINTEAERRKIAAMAMQGLLSNPNVFDDVVSRKKYYPQIAEDAIKAADALLMAFNMENLKEATDKIAELNGNN
jgi:hypothetical protein